MKMNWLQSLIFGLISGVTEILPISSDAHRKLFTFFCGLEEEVGMLLFLHLGCLSAVLFCCRKQLTRLLRERALASVPKRSRKRGLDNRVIATSRLIRAAAVPMLLGFFGYPFLTWIPDRLWILSGALLINGIVLYLPRRFSTGNKDARSMSALDGLVLGLLGAVGGIPGCSRLGFIASGGSVLGGERRFILDLCLLLFVPVLLVGAGTTGFQYFSSGAVVVNDLIRYFVAGAAAFGSACGAIFFLRFMAYKTGFTGFAYYSWGLALFTFAIYLIV